MIQRQAGMPVRCDVCGRKAHQGDEFRAYRWEKGDTTVPAGWLCPECDDGRAVGVVERDYDERGNPVPRPEDKCTSCGRRRDQVEELFVEILTPFGEVEHICKHCRKQGRGMK